METLFANVALNYFALKNTLDNLKGPPITSVN